jgi:hypothetical protein
MSTSTRGGGQYKEPVLVRLKEVFTGKTFTLAEAQPCVSGLISSFIFDFLNSGDIEIVDMSGDSMAPRYPQRYRISTKDQTQIKSR